MDDLGSVFWSLLLVFLVLVWVYPLRILFGTAFWWLSGMALPPEWRLPADFDVYGYDEIRSLFVIYGFAWGSLGLVIAALYRHAWRRRDSLGLDLEEQVRVRGEIATWLLVPATGALSIAIALLVPDPPTNATAGLPGLVYFLMFLSFPIGVLVERRERARLAAGERAGT